MVKILQESESSGHIFGCYDETQYGLIEFSYFGWSNSFEVRILHKNSVKHEFGLEICHFVHFGPLVLVPKIL